MNALNVFQQTVRALRTFHPAHNFALIVARSALTELSAGVLTPAVYGVPMFAAEALAATAHREAVALCRGWRTKAGALMDRALGHFASNERERSPAVDAAFLIVGLGNPGAAYAHTRHSVGFMVLDRIAERLNAPAFRTCSGGVLAECSPTVALLKPMNWMNRSGKPVRAAMRGRGVRLARLLVIHDDTDTAFGKVRPKASGSAGGHNGVRSVIDAAGNDGFARLRVGIGRDAEVLSAFSAHERERLPAVLDQAAALALEFIATGVVPPAPKQLVPPKPRRRGVAPTEATCADRK